GLSAGPDGAAISLSSLPLSAALLGVSIPDGSRQATRAGRGLRAGSGLDCLLSRYSLYHRRAHRPVVWRTGGGLWRRRQPRRVDYLRRLLAGANSRRRAVNRLRPLESDEAPLAASKPATAAGDARADDYRPGCGGRALALLRRAGAG